MDVDEFDVVVIGGGPAGENVAGTCAEGGLSTALVEAELLGGECSYWACIPSKTLLRPGQVLAAARRLPGVREAVSGQVDVAAVLARRDSMVTGWDDAGQVDWVEGTGATLVRGHGRLAGERAVEVSDAGGSVRRIEARRAVVVATGSAPVVPPIDGLRSIRIWDSRDVTSSKQVPRRLLVLGGGAVGVEMAQAWRRLGTDEVTVIARGRLLAKEEPFVGDELAAAFAAEGISVRTDADVVRAARAAPDAPVTLTMDDGTRLVGDELLVAAGRRPRTADIGLETIGLEPGQPVDVDDQLRAAGVPGGWLYAVGDCNGRALLTHMGKYQSRIVSEVIQGRPAEAWADHKAVPRVVFTDPEVASVGLTERAARDQGIDVRPLTVPLSSVAAAAIAGEGVSGTAHLVVDQARRVVVGATFTGPDVAELLHAATIAIAGEVPLDVLHHAVPSFPTMSELWLRLLGADDEQSG